MERIRENELKVIDIASHRNGIEGAPFHVVLFDDQGEHGGRKVAIVFDEPNHCAVLDVGKLAEGDIRSGKNSWRGDQYEDALREAIRDRFRID